MVRSSAPLVVQNRPQHAHDLDEFALRAGHSANVLVGRRRFISKQFRVSIVVPDTGHLPMQLARTHVATSLCAAHQTTGPVSTRAQRLSATPPLNVKTYR